MIGMFGFIIFSFLAYMFVPLMDQQTVEITVVEKIPYHNGNYLVIAKVGEKEEVFSVVDVWIAGIFDASDRYAYLKEGKTYTVTTGGYRFPPLSWYRNINVIAGRV